MKSTRRIVFDSHAVLKWTQKEKGYQKVRDPLRDCRSGSVSGFMNYLNLGEVYYKSIRSAGIEKAKVFLENFRRLSITLVAPEAELIWRACEIKAAYAISYADCFAAATALEYDAAVLTGDPEFRKIEALVPIAWL